jgi:O-antigen/teichoic acid export membrane protein
MGAERQVARNFLALGGGEALSRLLAFAATVYVARVLGVEGYGVIALAAGVTLYLAKVADFAIEAVGTHEVARDVGALPQLISAVMGIRLALTGLLVAVSVGTAQALLPDPERTVLSLYFLTLVPIAASTKWVHMGREDARPIGITRVVGEALALSVVVASVHGPSQLWLVPVAQLVGETFVVSVLYTLLVRAGLGFRLRWDPATALPIFRRALPLLAQIMLSLVLYNSDLMFLRFICDSASVGFYAAAYTVISFLGNLGFAYGMSLLPTLTRLGAGTDDERALYHTALAQTFALCFPISIGGYFLANGVVETTFGSAYLPAGPVLQILVWAVPLSTFRNVPWATLVARGRHDLLLRATAYAAGANVLLNVTLIYVFGMLGAAISTVLTESLAGVLMLTYGARQGLAFIPLARLLRPILAGLVMALALAGLAAQSMPLRCAVGVGVYGLALLLVGGIRLRRGSLPLLNL